MKKVHIVLFVLTFSLFYSNADNVIIFPASIELPIINHNYSIVGAWKHNSSDNHTVNIEYINNGIKIEHSIFNVSGGVNSLKKHVLYSESFFYTLDNSYNVIIVESTVNEKTKQWICEYNEKLLTKMISQDYYSPPGWKIFIYYNENDSIDTIIYSHVSQQGVVSGFTYKYYYSDENKICYITIQDHSTAKPPDKFWHLVYKSDIVDLSLYLLSGIDENFEFNINKIETYKTEIIGTAFFK